MFPTDYDRFVDIFGGSGSVLLGKEPCKFEVFNDIDGELVNLFRCVRDRLAELLLELGLLPLNSREEFGDWVRFQSGGRNPEIFLPTQDLIMENTLPIR